MEEMVRKALLLGVGTVYYTKERVEQLVDDLQKKDKITPEEGKKLVKELLEKSKKRRKSFESDVKKAVGKVIDEMGLATKKDIEELKKEMRRK